MALVFRLTLLAGWYAAGQGEHLSADSTLHIKIAQSLAAHEGFSVNGVPVFRRVPVYAAILSLAVRAGVFPLAIQLLQVLLGALSCLLLIAIGNRMGAHRAGIFAGFLLAVDYLLAKQCVYILPEIVFVTLILAFFYFWFNAVCNASVSSFAAAGVLAGLSVLTKEVLFLFYPGMAVMYIFTSRHRLKGLRAALIFLTAYVVCLMPWVARNSQLEGRFALLTNSSGLTFYLGNNPTVRPRLYGGDWIRGIDTVSPTAADIAAANATGDPDRWYSQQAILSIREHPLDFVKNMSFKAARLWYPFYHKAPLWAKWVAGLPYTAMALLALFGAGLTRTRWRDFLPCYLLIIYLTAVHAVTIPGIRYRYPAVPFLMLFAGFGLQQIWLQVKSKMARIGPT